MKISRALVAGNWVFSVWAKGVDPSFGKNPYDSDPYQQVGGNHNDLDAAKSAAVAYKQ